MQKSLFQLCDRNMGEKKGLQLHVCQAGSKYRFIKFMLHYYSIVPVHVLFVCDSIKKNLSTHNCVRCVHVPFFLNTFKVKWILFSVGREYCIL